MSWGGLTLLHSLLPSSSLPRQGQMGHPSMSSGEDNGTLLQYFCLENPVDGGALLESDTPEQLHFHFSLSCIGE